MFYQKSIVIKMMTNDLQCRLILTDLKLSLHCPDVPDVPNRRHASRQQPRRRRDVRPTRPTQGVHFIKTTDPPKS